MTPSRRSHDAPKEVQADHEFHVDILDDPAKATQCRLIVAGYVYCSIPRDQHPTAALHGAGSTTRDARQG